MSNLLAQGAEPQLKSNPCTMDRCNCGRQKIKSSGLCQNCRIVVGKSPVDPRTYIVDGIAIRRFPVRFPYYAIVNEDRYDLLNPYFWGLTSNPGKTDFYAMTKMVSGEDVSACVLMHRFIFGYPGDGMFVDHRDRRPLNNVIENLRIATPRQNQANKRLPSSNTSGFRGVVWEKNRKYWISQIKELGGKNRFLGYFPDKISAAHAYDAAARVIHGEFAVLNFPDPDKTPEMSTQYDFLTGRTAR